MNAREVRLLTLEQRADKRRRRRNAAWHVACGFERRERAVYWLALRREADALLSRLWLARVEAGTRRWAADSTRAALVAQPNE